MGRTAKYAVALMLAVSGWARGSGTEIAVNYVFDAPALSGRDNLTRISIGNCQTHHLKGAPELPFRTVKILIPSNSGVDSIAITPQQPTEIFEPDHPVEFGRTALPVGLPDHPLVQVAAADAPDASIYNTDALYPSNRVDLVSIQHLCGYSIAMIRLYPVQYNPARNQLHFTPEIEVTVTLSQSAAPLSSTTVNEASTEAARRRVAAFVDNPDALNTPAAPLDTTVAAPLDTTYDYLLVTASALTSAFQPLVEQKIADGLSVKVETMEYIRTNCTGIDDAEKLRNYIIDAYNNWNIEYVLLGGDTGTVPYRGVYAQNSGASYVENSMPCDLYFACLDGPWNYDGDSLWGESNDGTGGGDVDLLAEVYVGRAPVDTVAEAERFVAKTVGYEQSTVAYPANTRFLAEYLGEYSGTYAHGGDGLDTLIPHFSNYTNNWLDDRPDNDTTWNSTDCLAALNQSPHIVPHFGHANKTYVMHLVRSNLDQLTNTDPFLINSAGCLCGAFDYDDCIAEEFVKRNDHGAFAVIMNSRYGWFSPANESQLSSEFMKHFFDELLDQGTINIGAANQLAKHTMVGSVGSIGVYRWCYFEINLLGDPHTPLQPWDPILDRDGDTMLDSWEVTHFGNRESCCATDDPDRDGHCNLEEYITGMDPNNAGSCFMVTNHAVQETAGSFKVEWNAMPGRTYKVMWSPNIRYTAFKPVESDIQHPRNSCTDTEHGTRASGFYRVDVELD